MRVEERWYVFLKPCGEGSQTALGVRYVRRIVKNRRNAPRKRDLFLTRRSRRAKRLSIQ